MTIIWPEKIFILPVTNFYYTIQFSKICFINFIFQSFHCPPSWAQRWGDLNSSQIWWKYSVSIPIYSIISSKYSIGNLELLTSVIGKPSIIPPSSDLSILIESLLSSWPLHLRFIPRLASLVSCFLLTIRLLHRFLIALPQLILAKIYYFQ